MQLELRLGEDRLPGLRAMESAVAGQSAANQRQAERNADLRAEIANLELGNEAAEERARSELGMMLPNESYYQIVGGPDPRAANGTADGAADGPPVTE